MNFNIYGWGICIILILFTILILVPPITYASVKYTLTDLEPDPLYSSEPVAINNSNHVIGHTFGKGSFFWSVEQGMVHYELDAMSINDKDQIIGNGSTFIDGLNTYTYTFNNGITNFLQYSTSMDSFKINNNGQFVGFYYHALPDGQKTHAFRYDNSLIDLGSLGGDLDRSKAWSINSTGQVVGDSDIKIGVTHAFRTKANSPINPATDDIGTLGGSHSFARDINDLGHVVGFSLPLNDYQFHAFLYDNQMRDLGLLPGTTSCFANAINELDQVVGLCANGDDEHAFLYENDTLKDLDSMIPSEWKFERAVDINDNGYIAGVAYSYKTSTRHAILLSPITGSPPIVGPIIVLANPLQINTPITATADFTDPDTSDVHTAVWSWGDGTTTTCSPNSNECILTESNGSGEVNGTHTYASTGVYTITLEVTDNHGGVGQQIYQFIAVYDPDAGFVTGGGTINSPQGAYAPDKSLTGKANFGFVSKYQKGANVPTGNTEFNFNTAKFIFHSDTYDWLVVSGAKGQYKGSGTINGTGDYGFILTAIDGQINGGGGVDKFRIKITDKNSGRVIYDNQSGADDNSDPTTTINSGSVVIHKD